MNLPQTLTVCIVLAAHTAPAGTFKNISIDGSFGDWTGVPLAHEDPADSATSADYRRIWIANDQEYLYLRFTLERPDNPFTSNDNIFIDADNDVTTGFAIIVGSEMLIQGGAGYQERNGGFNEGGINGLDWAAAPSGSGTEFEARISRKATFASDGQPVFANPVIALLLEAEDSNFTRRETAPDGEGLVYEFAEPPSPLNGSRVLIPLAYTWRVNSSPTGPGTDWASPDYDDTGAGWTAGPALLGYTSQPSTYPIPVATPLPTGVTTHYLRTRFDWSNDPSGVVFVVSNHLSDGAIFRLNGTEVRRVRLPDGEVGPATPATGSAPNPGPAELFAIPPGPLIIGENVLAVEVHQSTTTPSDLVFGASLLASTSYPVTFPDPNQPEDRAVVAGETASFQAEVIGSLPLTFQWLRDGEPIEDATNQVYTLPVVLAEDAGTYSVRVSNAASPTAKVSRAATLTVLTTPVEILTQPESRQAAEGDVVTFSVSVGGSAPISYQWFKGSQAIPGATNSTLTVDPVTLASAGEYSVEARNPAPSNTRSAVARLTVLPDTTPPSLLGVSASPDQVRLVFSEPVDPATAAMDANYAFTGGLRVVSAAVDGSRPEAVVVRTSQHQLGSRYEVTVSGLKDRFGNPLAGPNRRAFISTIAIDGSFEDWQGVAQVIDDPEDAPSATDYAAAWIFSDSDFIYLRVKLHTASQLGIFYNNMFIDADANPETGFRFRGLGSEMLIQSGAGYQEKNGAFNEGPIEGLDWTLQPEGVGREFEFRISRRATYASDGQRVFAGPQIALYLESENTSFQTIDVAPDDAPLTFTLLDSPPVDLPALAVAREGAGIRLSWSGAGRLQSAPVLAPATWTDVPNASSPYTVSPAAGARFYRLVQ